jgi:histidinol-phosphate aminotransferase
VQAYVPGEQPRIPGLIKLNTNENPYPPAPQVLAAIRGAVDERLRLYPPPNAPGLRARLARLHGCRCENVVIGNGSDELLEMVTRAFVEPVPGTAAPATTGPWARPGGRAASRATIQFFVPSYSLYPVLAATHGARANPLPLKPDFSIPTPDQLARGGVWDFRAALTYVTTPNAPSGRGYSTAELDALCAAQHGVVVLDEAYADFAREHALALALRHPHVLVARTFSKAYSLCFQRVGYMVGHPELIAALDRVRDSYNVNGLGQVGASATLASLAYYRRNIRRLRATRERVAQALRRLSFQVFPSQTNFLLVRPPGAPAETWLRGLRQRRILVRWFASPELRSYLRITIGTDREMDALLAVVQEILRRPSRGGRGGRAAV